MTTLALAYSAVQKKANINWKVVCAMGFCATCCFMVFHVFLINQLTRGTYLIKNYNSQIDSLLQENKQLEVNFAKTGFMGSVEQRAKELNFEKTVSVKYIQVLDSSLARNK